MTYLFTRSLRLAAGNLLDSMAWSVKITEKVNAVSDTPVALWTPTLSPDIGRLTWTAVTEDLSALSTMEEKLMADPGYLGLVEEGARYNSGEGVTDGLIRYVHADRDGVATAQFSSVVQAVLAPGAAVSGITLGVEIAQRAKAITGRSTSFGASQTGIYGQVGWISLFDTIEQVQAASEALAADADFAAMLDAKASKAYLAGHSAQFINRKVA